MVFRPNGIIFNSVITLHRVGNSEKGVDQCHKISKNLEFYPEMDVQVSFQTVNKGYSGGYEYIKISIDFDFKDAFYNISKDMIVKIKN